MLESMKPQFGGERERAKRYYDATLGSSSSSPEGPQKLPGPPYMLLNYLSLSKNCVMDANREKELAELKNSIMKAEDAFCRQRPCMGKGSGRDNYSSASFGGEREAR